MGGSSGEEGFSSVLRKGVEISSMEEGGLDGSRRLSEQNQGSLLRRGLKFSSMDEFLNFLNEGEGNDEWLARWSQHECKLSYMLSQLSYKLSVVTTQM